MFSIFTHLVAVAVGLLVGAFIFKNNPLKGAAALAQLEDLYKKEKAKLQGQ